MSIMRCIKTCNKKLGLPNSFFPCRWSKMRILHIFEKMKNISIWRYFLTSCWLSWLETVLYMSYNTLIEVQVKTVSILRLFMSMCMIIHQQMIKNEHKLHDISSPIVFCWSIQQYKLPKKSSEDCLSSRLSIRTMKNIGHGLRFRAIVMSHTLPPDRFLLCLSILYFGVGFLTYAYK